MTSEARPIVALGGGAVIATTVAGKTPTAASEIPVESSLPVQVEAGDFAGTLLEKADITVTGKIRDMMPDWATQNPFLLENWQWMGILGIIIVGKILDLFLMMFLVNVVRRIFDRRGVEFDREATRKSLRPFGLLLMGAFWWATVHLLGLPETAQAVILVAAKFIVVGAVVWSVYRLVDIFSNFMMAKAEKTKSKFDDLLIPLVRKSIKIFIALVGALFVAGNIPGLDIGSILAGKVILEIVGPFFPFHR